MTEKREQLAHLMWNCVDILRGHVESEEYPRYIFGMIFLKVLHDFREAIGQQTGWYLDKAFQWKMLFESYNYQAFHQYLGRLTATAPAEIRYLIDTINLYEFPRTLGQDIFRLAQVLEGFSFHEDSRYAIVEALTSIIEPNSSRSYMAYHSTPDNVSNLLVKLAQPRGNVDIYDPTCGTGRLLLNAYREAKTFTSDATVRLFGQEISTQTATLASILMIIAGVEHSMIRIGDTLTTPEFRTADGSLKQFDIVLANLPFGVRVDRRKQWTMHDEYGRFRYGFTANGDMLFLEHIVASLSATGRATVISAPGALFRSGVEGQKRKGLIEADLIEAVIELPNGILLNTGIAPAILILNRHKAANLRNRVLFVDAKKSFIRYHQRIIIDPDHQERILDVIEKQAEIDGFSRLVLLEEIANNNFVLLPSTYLYTVEPNATGFLVKSAQLVRLQEIASIYQGTRNNDAVIKGEGSTPIIQGRDLSSLSLAVEDLELIRIVAPLKTEVYAQQGDILIQRIGERPHAYLVEDNLEGVLVWNTVYVVRPDEAHQYLRHFLVEYLNSAVWYKYLNRTMRVGTGAPTLGLSVLKESVVPSPSQEAVTALGDLYMVERDMQTRLNKLRELKDSLFNIEDEMVLQEQISHIAIRERIVIQTIEQADDFEYQIRNLYPFMLAFPYRLLSAMTVPAEKYLEQLRVGENLMAFFGSICLAMVGYTGNPTSAENDWLNTELATWWQSGISPGDWQEMGRRSSQIIRESSNPTISEISSVWFKGKTAKPSEFRNNLKRLGEILNDFKHGRGPKTTYQYQAAVTEAENLLKSCLESVSVLTQHQIHLVINSDIEWKTKQTIVNTLVHMGDHPGHRPSQTVSNVPLTQNHLYIASTDKEWISLYPLLCVQHCQICQTQETFMVDRWDGFGKRLVLKSFERGHALDTSAQHAAALDLRDDFEHFLRQITNRNPS